MIIDDRYIIEFTKDNLWQLSKSELKAIVESLGIEFKKSTTKDDLISSIKCSEEVNYLDIYDKYKRYSFGIYPTVAQEMLNIDNKTLKKLAKKEIIKVAYTREKRAYGKYIDVPYYLLESFKISEDDLNKAIEKYCKTATDKQLEALEKAREVSLLNRTCSVCGNVVGNKKHIKDGKCISCINEEKEIANAELNKLVVKETLEDMFKNKSGYVILDTETTGLSDTDVCVEIGICSLDGKALLNTKVYTDVEISTEASLVNGIYNKDLVGAPTIQELKSTLDEILKGKTVLIFNAKFDTRILKQSGYNTYINAICLMEMYMEYCSSDRWIGLQQAMDQEGIKINQDHSAFGDCLCCLELIKKIVN